MPLLLGAVADDYTGASDLANTLHRNGLSTIQTIGVPAPGLEVDDAEAIVVALKIRSIEARRAVEAASAAYDWLSARGARHVMYKVCSTFDSTDAGDIGPVADALGAKAHSGCALVTPAFRDWPDRLSGSSVRRPDALEREPAQGPPAQSDARFQSCAVSQRQSKGPFGLIDLMTVEQGAARSPRPR